MAERLHVLLTLFLVTQTRVNNVPLFAMYDLQLQSLSVLLGASSTSTSDSQLVALTTLLFSYVSYYCMGGSNAISSIDLSHAYNGVSGYNVVAVGVLLFCSNWAGPIWWDSAGIQLLHLLQRPETEAANGTAKVEKPWVLEERALLERQANGNATGVAEKETNAVEAIRAGVWQTHVTTLTLFVATSLCAVMIACTALRTHLFIWTVFSPKYLYAMAWSIGWHWVVSLGLGGFLYALGPTLRDR